MVAETIESITGESVQITCIVGEPKPAAPDLPASGEVSHTVSASNVSSAPGASGEAEVDYYVQQAEEEASKRPMTAISNIFGGGELLES